MLILLPLLAIGAWWRARGQGLPLHSGLSRVLGLVAGVLLVLLPVAIRNSTVGGVFALSTSGAGTNLYGGNNLENPYGRASEFSFVRGIPEHEAEDWEHEAERRSGRELDRGEVSRFWAGEVAASVARDPLAHLSILWNKFRLTLHRYEVPDNHCIDWDRQYLPLTKAPWPDFGFVGLVSLAGLFCWLLRREWHSAAGVLCLCFALYLLTIVLTVTSDRSRLPLVPLLLPFGGWWLAQGLVDWRRRLVCAVPAALVVLLPALPADEEARDFAEREHNYAVTRLKQGRLAEARAITAPLLQAMPDSVRVQLLHAEIELRSGAQDPPALQAQLARLAADPRLRARERFHADVLAGQLALERRDSEAARVHLESARRFDPEDPVLIETWVIALAQGCELGRWGFDQLRLSASLLERVGPITRAGVEYLEGRTLRRENPGSAAGAAAIESALDRLQAPSLDKSLPAEERARARKLAGKIQLELGRKAQAANHFRAALSLLPGDAEALAGLAAAQAP
jgi:tetratricopeptide (TPR) repeat protein